MFSRNVPSKRSGDCGTIEMDERTVKRAVRKVEEQLMREKRTVVQSNLSNIHAINKYRPRSRFNNTE